MHTKVYIMVYMVMSLFLAGCGVSPEKGADNTLPRGNVASPETPLPVQKRIIPRPARWGIWLQSADPAQIAGSDTDLVVVDYSADGSEDRAFTRAEVAQMQTGGRKVLSYFSIGEAESYRFYWKPEWKNVAPPFLGPENPDWPENFKVRYWHEQWWDEALRPYMDRILAAGFDGVYLDIVDGYWYWGEQGRDVKTCADDMMRLVNRIANYLRERGGPDMIVCPQNAEGIFNDGTGAVVEKYLKHIDMVGIESLLFNVTPEDSAYRKEILKRVADAGKTVLNIEYIPLSDVPRYREMVQGLPFRLVPYRADPDAALSSMAIQQP